MISISKPLSAGSASTYHSMEFTSAKENYYATGATITGQWHGRFAEALGLRGDVRDEQFQRLAHGQDPTTGQTYIRTVASTNARMGHRAGWDATFSAPKSVSLIALVGGDDRVRVAHRESVRTALDELEQSVQARMGGNLLPETTRHCAAALFEHDSARPVAGYAAPQLHTHAVLFNMTRTAEGRIRSIQPREIFKAQAFATAVYRAELAVRLKTLGYEIEVGRSGQPEVKGFTQAYLDASSPRRDQIQAYLLAHGYTGPAAAHIAAHRTREPKLDQSREYVLAQHQVMAEAHGNQPQRAVSAALARCQERQYAVNMTAAKDAVQYAKDRGMERSAVVEARGVLTDALKRGLGHTTVRAIRDEFERRVTVGEFVARTPAPASTTRAFTTPEMLALEAATIARMRTGQGQAPPLVDEGPRARLAVTHPHLSADQQQAAVQILASRDQVIGLEGIAGSGKTTTLAAVHAAATRAGYEVVGVAPSSTAAHKLADAGMPTETLQRFLTANRLPTGPRLLVLDESSLASTTLMHDFLDRMRPTDRVLLVGDVRQHQSVDAGKSFEQLQDQGLTPARLDHVVRQHGPGYRRIVEQLARGEVRPALEDLTRRGRVHEIPAREARLAAVATAFLAQPRGTIVVAPDNESRTAINQAIHDALQRERPAQAATRVLVAKAGLTGSDRRYADLYEVGDVVRYAKGSANLGLARGSYATVVATSRATNTLTVQRADGSTVAYDPRRVSGVGVYEHQDRVFQPGDTIQFTAPSRPLQVVNRQRGTIEAIDATSVTLVLDAGRRLTYPLDAHRHLDYGYATTSHSSQSLTAERVLVHIDSDHSAEAIVNLRTAYVALSRGRSDAQIYTNSTALLGRALSRDHSHRAALEQGQAVA